MMMVVLNCFLAYNNYPDIFDRKITFQGRIELMNQDGQFKSSYSSIFDTIR